MKKIFKKILFGLLVLLLIFIGYFCIGSIPQAKEITWGVNFSQTQAESLGLNWQESYLAILEDLNVKHLKIATYWDLLELAKGEYSFEDLDWQIKEAEKNETQLLLVIGMKTPRWPECHIPEWAKSLTKEAQQEKILKLIENIVLRYESSPSIWAWQMENEPFFPFGECPWVDKKFLKKEIDLVKSLDTKHHPIVISDSGEGSFWIAAAQLGDIVGTTMYKKVWVHQIGFYFTYPFPSVFYHRKAEIIRWLFNKEVICTELQTEPWGPELLSHSPIEEQQKSMDLEQFKYNIEFAKNTGLNKFYLWGAEWWYWMKEIQGQPEIWDEFKKLFNKNL